MNRVAAWHLPETPAEDVPEGALDRAAKPLPKRLPPAATSESIRITCQFREPGTMVYELTGGRRLIEVRVRAPEAPSNHWIVAMVVKTDNESASLSGVGVTRLIAMEAMKRAPGALLNAEEWAGLHRALQAVRAL